MEEHKTLILKVLAGSRGYGIYDEDSDYDYRGVYVVPTEMVLGLDAKLKGTHWVEDRKGGEDETYYEVGHFVSLALHCNPTILNTLKAPVVESHWLGDELIKIFRCFLDPKRCRDAFVGYGLNQRKKMLENKDNRWQKYGAAYIRQLMYLRDLFQYGDYSFVIKDLRDQEVIRAVRDGQWSPGQIIDFCKDITELIDMIVEKGGWPKIQQDREAVNQYLLKVRREFWDVGRL